MVGPINYQLDVLNPIQQATQGFANGLQISSAIDAQKAQRAEQKLKQQQAEMKMQQQQMQQEDLYNFSIMPNKTADDYAQIIARYPQLAEQYQKAWGIMNEGQQQQALATSSQIYAALNNGANDVAKQILDEQITGYENSGMKEEAFNLKRLKAMVDNNPDAARESIGLMMASAIPDKFKDIFGTLGSERRDNQMQPYEIDKIESETANNYSQIGDREVKNDIERTKVQNQNDQFYTNLEQQQQQFYDSLSQDERIKAKEMAQKREETSKDKTERLEKVSNFAIVANGAANTANLAAELINDFRSLGDATGAGVWNAAMRNIPGTAEYDFAQRVETLKNQVFLMKADGMRGLGALTEKEGARLDNSISSLNLSQNTAQVTKSLVEIAKAANNLAQHANRQSQMYATKGQGYSQDVIKAAQQLGITPAEAQAFVNQNGL